MALKSIIQEDDFDRIQVLDKELSKRFISLDPKGYFLIRLDNSSKELVVEHYSNDIDELGRAIDPKTGKPISCEGDHKRVPTMVFRGMSAKEVGVKLTEGKGPFLLSKLDHALYLGRELQKAEECLRDTKHYVQD